MKKILSALVLLSLLAVLALPLIALAQEVPALCCQLRKAVRWTNKIIIDTVSLDCSSTKPCIFKATLAVGEKIAENQCGETTPVTLKCTDPGAFADQGTYYEQRESCLAPKEWGMICILNTIYNVTDWIFIIFIAIAVIFIIAGAFMFMTAGGVPEKTTAARNFILYAVIGIVVALLAKAIPAIVRFIVGV